MPPIVRLALALAVAPLAEPQSHHGALHENFLAQILCAGLLGAGTGLIASGIASAAASAGGLVDGVLAVGSIAPDRIFGQSTGPFGILIPLAFAFALTSTGALTWLIAGFASAENALAEAMLRGAPAHFSLHLAESVATSLGRVVFATALAVAMPALAAHAFGVLLAAIVARFAPRVNGMLLASALGPALMLAVMMAAVPAILSAMAGLARMTAHAGPL